MTWSKGLLQFVIQFLGFSEFLEEEQSGCAGWRGRVWTYIDCGVWQGKKSIMRSTNTFTVRFDYSKHSLMTMNPDPLEGFHDLLLVFKTEKTE